MTRRDFIRGGLAAGIGLKTQPIIDFLNPQSTFPVVRRKVGERHFTSPVIEETITTVQGQIANPELAWLFGNCFPNTLDTTVTYKEENGKPLTFVITGDIDAMWLRDSSAQVWPYLPLAKKDPKLQKLIAGVIRRQSRGVILDPYANAFYDDPSRQSEWHTDFTLMKPGVHERKWEVDSLCYTIRLAHGYWKATGDTSPFDDEWEKASDLIVQTFREQQRKEGKGPYHFLRDVPNPSLENPLAFGSPIKPNGLICSRFRPSDDPTQYQFLIPSNYFAATSLRELATMLDKICHQPKKAAAAKALADEVDHALKAHARHQHETFGEILPFEIDGLGNQLLMDDANVPSLLAMPYLGLLKKSDPLYKSTRKFVMSPENEQFYVGKYSGIGGHAGPDMVWPMYFIMRGLTSDSQGEVTECLRILTETHAGTGFMHEAFHKDDPKRFSRSWFAWANTLFGEFVLDTLKRFPEVLKKP